MKAYSILVVIVLFCIGCASTVATPTAKLNNQGCTDVCVLVKQDRPHNVIQLSEAYKDAANAQMDSYINLLKQSGVADINNPKYYNYDLSRKPTKVEEPLWTAAKYLLEGQQVREFGDAVLEHLCGKGPVSQQEMDYAKRLVEECNAYTRPAKPADQIDL